MTAKEYFAREVDDLGLHREQLPCLLSSESGEGSLQSWYGVKAPVRCNSVPTVVNKCRGAVPGTETEKDILKNGC